MTTIFTKSGPLHLSAADAKDAVTYRRAKAEAERIGSQLIIDPPPAEDTRERPAEGSITLNPAEARDPATYRRLKAKAAAEGKPLVYTDDDGFVK